MSRVDEFEQWMASCGRKAEAIKQVYQTAYEATESFEVCPELTAFLLYVCGAIAGGDGGLCYLEASKEVSEWVENTFAGSHPIWGYIQVIQEAGLEEQE